MSCSPDMHCSLLSFHTTEWATVLSMRLESLWCTFSMHRCSLPYAWLGWSVLLSIKCGQTCTAAFCSARLFQHCDTFLQNKFPKPCEGMKKGQQRGNNGGENRILQPQHHDSVDAKDLVIIGESRHGSLQQIYFKSNFYIFRIPNLKTTQNKKNLNHHGNLWSCYFFICKINEHLYLLTSSFKCYKNQQRHSLDTWYHMFWMVFRSVKKWVFSTNDVWLFSEFSHQHFDCFKHFKVK